MKQRKLMNVVSVAIAIICTLPLQAQDDDASAPFSRLNIALRAATTGFGLEVATPLNNHFNARAGVDYFGYQSRYYDILIKDNANQDLYDAFGYVPDYHAKGKLNLFHGRLLADYHPAGIFHLTAGLYLGDFKAHVNGYLADRNNVNQPAKLKDDAHEWPTIDFDGHQIDLTDGRANLDLQLGNFVKPYFGLGVGRAVTKRKVGFKFELGVLYLGDYSLSQNGEKINLSGGSSDVKEVADVHEYLQMLQWYPMLSIQLSYRLF
ncbi:MAG: hypothetical protein LBT83_05645 [Tannerella sp.]|nr:hypothetical protein [Tannerella sp.]